MAVGTAAVAGSKHGTVGFGPPGVGWCRPRLKVVSNWQFPEVAIDIIACAFRKPHPLDFAVEIENRIMIESDGDLLQTFARIYVRLLSFP